MSDDITRALKDYVDEGERILREYETELTSLKSTSARAGQKFWSGVAGAIASDVLDSKSIGRDVKSLSRAKMREDTMNAIKALDERTKRKVDNWITKITTFLQGVASKTSSAESPDTNRLVSRFAKVSEFVKPPTQLIRGIRILESFIRKGLVKIEDLKTKKTKRRGFIAAKGQQFEAYRKVLEIIKEVKEFVIVVDAYPGEATLVAIQKTPKDIPVTFLTNPPKEEEDRVEFEILAKKLMKDRSEIKILYAPKWTLHDRHIVSKDSAWLLGSSIKDIGNKPSTMTPLHDDDARDLLQILKDLIESSTPL